MLLDIRVQTTDACLPVYPPVEGRQVRSVFEVRNDEFGGFLSVALRFSAWLCVTAITQRLAEEAQRNAKFF